MKAIVAVILLLEVVNLSTCIPLENPSQSDKYLAGQVRQKRGGWGYETAWIPSHGPAVIASSPILGPSKTIITSPVAVAPSTTLVVPQRVATVSVPSGTHAESFVYSSGPDHTYYVHQKHSPHTTYYYHYPASTVHYHHPTTHYVAGVPVISTWP